MTGRLIYSAWLDTKDKSVRINSSFTFPEKIMSDITKEKLIDDIKLVIADTEELLRATAGQAGEKVTEIRAKATDRIALMKTQLMDAETVLIEKAKAVGRVTDDYVHENPWRSIGTAAGIGFIVGLLIGRR